MDHLTVRPSRVRSWFGHRRTHRLADIIVPLGTVHSTQLMIGEDAFCPKTGAPLSEQSHYDEQGQPCRIVTANEHSLASQSAGELTTGAARSSKAALFNRFRDCHQHHRPADDALYRKAALALSRLKRTAEGTASWDVHVWYALQRRLTETGHDVEWMHAHVAPRCPHCHGQLRYEEYDTGDVAARCATNCTASHDQLPEIRETIATLYREAFDEPVAATDFIQF